ncbi:MAG: quinoprotein relay system zinc metallohydrolase 2 [Gammaproteobacteria bacterium]
MAVLGYAEPFLEPDTMPEAGTKTPVCTLAVLFCLLIPPPVSAEFALQEVADGIYVHQGRHLSISAPHNDDIANIGFIVGGDCIAVVDTGGSVAAGRRLYQAMREVSSLPVCYVINTHIHFDHVLGNVAFVERQVKYVGHENLAGAIEDNREFFLQNFADNLGAEGADAVIGPDIIVQDSLQLDLGQRVLSLQARSVAHSHTDLTVYDHNTRTLWAGDLLFKQRIPALDGSLKGWLQLLDALQREDIARVVPGHGPAVLTWPEAMDDQRRYLDVLLQQTRDAIAAGGFMEDIVEQVGTQEKLNWLLYEENHKRNVTRAFTELEWE